MENKVRKVFLDNLPTMIGFGANENRRVINWKESIGYTVQFIYDDIKGEFQIINYTSSTQEVVLKYNGNIKAIKTAPLSKGMLGKVVGKITKDFRLEIGTHIKDDKRDLIIIDREYRKKKRGQSTESEKQYKYKCNKCTYKGWIREDSLLTQKTGCYCCSPYKKVVVLGINTIWDTDRWMCDLGVSEEDAKKYTRSSDKKIEVKCPNCNNTRKIAISKISYSKSIRCACGDGFSYPEKFMYSLLKQLNVELEVEYTPEYMKNKRSDFYLPKYKLVIETDGGIGHKDGKAYGKSYKTLEELISNDNWKEDQHLKHGIKTIRINCFESNMEYIKNNILKSELVNVFDLSNIDWVECEKFALKNIVKEVCDCWNILSIKTVVNVAKETGYNKCTVRNYLKKGVILGWCDYDAELEMLKRTEKLKEFRRKPLEIFKNGECLGEFKSIKELVGNSEELFGVKMYSSGVSQVCKGVNRTYKGFTFKYKSK